VNVNSSYLAQGSASMWAVKWRIVRENSGGHPHTCRDSRLAQWVQPAEVNARARTAPDL